MTLPKQAAILCGGLGTRLRPYTLDMPKPMIPINKKPFLEYLIEQLKENGISEIILMTGYLGEKIHKYFGNGERLNIEILYSKGPVEWSTGRRLYEIKELLNDHFMLLYSDNFVPFNLEKAYECYIQKNVKLSFVVQSKISGNIRLREDGIVDIYDKSRSASNLDMVELGYMIVSKKVFEYYPPNDKNIDFYQIIDSLAKEKQLAGFEIRDKYYSISDPERLNKMRNYLTPKKILLIDRDGVINKKAPKGEYITSWKEFKFIPETIKAMKKLSDNGFKFIIITNQACIGRGIVTKNAINEINNKMIKFLEKEGISILQLYMCPHHWDDNCHCRKPKPGLFFQASRDWSFRLDKTFYIGDDSRDCQAAYNAGCKCIFIGEQPDISNLDSKKFPELIVKNLQQGMEELINNDYF